MQRDALRRGRPDRDGRLSGEAESLSERLGYDFRPDTSEQLPKSDNYYLLRRRDKTA